MRNDRCKVPDLHRGSNCSSQVVNRGVFHEGDTDSEIEADFERNRKAGSYFGK
jgi:hypothetical protein